MWGVNLSTGVRDKAWRKKLLLVSLTKFQEERIMEKRLYSNSSVLFSRKISLGQETMRPVVLWVLY